MAKPHARTEAGDRKFFDGELTREREPNADNSRRIIVLRGKDPFDKYGLAGVNGAIKLRRRNKLPAANCINQARGTGLSLKFSS